MLTIEIVRDDHSESPREWTNVGVMACWHRRYRLGDVRPDVPPSDWLAANAPKGSVVLPIFMYDHGGYVISTQPFACPWDSGQLGVIVATPTAIREAFCVKRLTARIRAKAVAALCQEVETYNEYLTGNVWSFRVVNQDGETEDSCSGFLGDNAYINMREHLKPELHSLLATAWEARYS
jgi:hypothetical protein